MSGDLNPQEPHPASLIVFQKIKSMSAKDLLQWQEVFASTALSGNRCAEVCFGTINRLLEGKPVSDRYIMGLFLTMHADKVDAI